MIKHIIFPLMLLILVLSFCLFSATYVTATINNAEALLDQAIASYKNEELDTAIKYLNTAFDLWTERQVYFGMVLKHEDADEISSEFSRLLSYARSSDKDDFLSNSSALKASLSHIREMEWPHLQNIL